MIEHLETMEKVGQGWHSRKGERFTQKTPILGAVAVDVKGDLIATCFKGQINETLADGRDITWDKHCEYSLFRDVIQLEDIPSLQGGNLYVTLEPCNKRGFYYDGEMGESVVVS
jgi:tRNA(Arg) A34 adenosine deaminase TadA